MLIHVVAYIQSKCSTQAPFYVKSVLLTELCVHKEALYMRPLFADTEYGKRLFHLCLLQVNRSSSTPSPLTGR